MNAQVAKTIDDTWPELQTHGKEALCGLFCAGLLFLLEESEPVRQGRTPGKAANTRSGWIIGEKVNV